MRLELSSIIDRPGESVAYFVSVDLNDLVYGNSTRCWPDALPRAFVKC